MKKIEIDYKAILEENLEQLDKKNELVKKFFEIVSLEKSLMSTIKYLIKQILDNTEIPGGFSKKYEINESEIVFKIVNDKNNIKADFFIEKIEEETIDVIKETIDNVKNGFINEISSFIKNSLKKEMESGKITQKEDDLLKNLAFKYFGNKVLEFLI